MKKRVFALVGALALLALPLSSWPARAAEPIKLTLGYRLTSDQLEVKPQDFKFWADVCDEVGVLHHPVDPATLIFK